MTGLIRKGAVVATSAALAFGGLAAPAVAKHGNKGHHSKWSVAKCAKQQAQWSKSHKHPSHKQVTAENKLLQKHGCAQG